VRSPFPGLDPYLQRFWPSVHHRLITYAGDLLADRLPGSMNIIIEERIVFESDEGDIGRATTRGYVPDVAIIADQLRDASQASSTGGAAVAEPMTIRYQEQPISQGFIEIRDAASGGKVITTIEFLSPSNKLPGPARDAFVVKQSDMRRGNVSLVEIDLIRGGEWVVTLPRETLKTEAQTDLKIAILRGWMRDTCLFYPIRLDQQLPTIPIPLRKTDEPLSLDLQVLLDLCYARGHYANLIDYSKEPLPPLAREEQRWAHELLRKAGKIPV
jgi:hypothetical protein